jgi:hypothetical protein
MPVRRAWGVFFLGLSLLAFPAQMAYLASGVPGTPQLINLYFDWQLPEEDLAKLAKWDVVVLDVDQQARFPERVRRLRELNPRIKILAYIASEEIAEYRFQNLPSFPMTKIANQIPDAWYVKGPSGNQMYFWAGSRLLNVTDRGGVSPSGERWNEFLPRFIHDEVMTSGLWDGIFLDNTFGALSWFVSSPVDLDRDGKPDDKAQTDRAWSDGMKKIIRRIREANPGILLIGNGGVAYADQLNGVMYEHFPSWGGWERSWKEVRDTTAKHPRPSLAGINVNTKNDQRPNDYQLMRYGLASALMANVYYSFDQGDTNHRTLWWYDEYDAPLGSSNSAARNASGVWSRRFDRGMVLVNNSDRAREVKLPGTFEKIHGTQDPQTNDGALVNSVQLAANDGLLLIGRAQATEVVGSPYINGSFMKLYDENGHETQNGFFAQREDVASGKLTLAMDLNQDGGDELVTADQGVVNILPGNAARAVTIRPFGKNTKSISLAVGNTDRDPGFELVLGREGGSPEVKVYALNGKERSHWMAYHPKFQGGVRVAVGDLDGNGLREIVTGAGPGGGPHVKIWKTDGKTWGGGFFAFDPTDSGGISVACGDVDGDGKDEIIVGSGQGARPRVRIFNFRGTLLHELQLGDRVSSQGLRVTASDVNGDGRAEILVGGLQPF